MPKLKHKAQIQPRDGEDYAKRAKRIMELHALGLNNVIIAQRFGINAVTVYKVIKQEKGRK